MPRHQRIDTGGQHCWPDFRRLAACRGTTRAAVAVGHTISRIVSRELREGDGSRDVGERSCDGRDRHAVARRLVAHREGLGHTVSLDPAT